MDETALNDLKEFITVTVSQRLSNQTEELKDTWREDIDAAKSEILAAIGDTMTNANDGVDTQLKDHESRITKLETAAS